ncbi:MAG: hypothetical protein ACREUM_07895 [Nitrosospira sp.]
MVAKDDEASQAAPPTLPKKSGLTRLAAFKDGFADFQKHSPEAALESAEALYKAWRIVLDRNTESLTDEELANTDDLPALWREASASVGKSFVSALARAEELIHQEGYKGWDPFLNSTLRELLTSAHDLDAAAERRLLAEYLHGIWNCHFTEVVGSPVMGMTPEGWDQFIYWSIQAISEVASASGQREHLELGCMMTAFLSRRARKAVAVRDQTDFDRRDAMLGSLVVVQELHQLAERSANVVKRYGEKHVEKRFEQQLSLLFQSFGFVVVATGSGERRVDLICFAPGVPGPGYSMLVEAKSTKNKYTLPTKDSRAIEDYVRDAKSKLITLPPLKLVLIIGPEIAHTVPNKIRALEASTGVPVRYCDASLLARTRRELPGTLPLATFLNQFLESGPIIESSAIRSIVEADNLTRSAHVDFVKALLSKRQNATAASLPSTN